MSVTKSIRSEPNGARGVTQGRLCLRPERFLRRSSRAVSGRPVMAGLVVLALAACGADDAPPADETPGPAGADTGRDVSADATDDADPQPDRWTVETLDVDQVVAPQYLAATAYDLAIGLAFYTSTGREDPCGLLEPPDDVDRPVWRATWAAPSPGGEWALEPIAEIATVTPVAPRGIDTLVRDGVPIVATPTGVPEIFGVLPTCGPHDAGYHRRASDGTWETVTLVRESGEANTGEPAADFGNSVGHYPALAAVDGDLVLAYRDHHNLSIQSERGGHDLEVAWGDDVLPVQTRMGGGLWNRATPLPEGELAIAHVITELSSSGVWVSRGHDRAWRHVRLEALGQRVAIAQAGDRLLVAYLDVTTKNMVLRTLPAGADFEDPTAWSRTTISDASSATALPIALAATAAGRPTAAWISCADAECTEPESLVFGWQEDDGSWTREVIDQAGAGTLAIALVYDDANRPWLAWTGGDTVTVARRPAAP